MSRRYDPISERTVGLLERMIKMAQLESQGLLPTAIVETVVAETGCSLSAAWRTWQARDKWKPLLIGVPEELGMGYVNLFSDLREIRRLGMNAYYIMTNEFARLQGLMRAADAATKEIKARQGLGISPRVPVKYELEVTKHVDQDDIAEFIPVIVDLVLEEQLRATLPDDDQEDPEKSLDA